MRLLLRCRIGQYSRIRGLIRGHIGKHLLHCIIQRNLLIKRNIFGTVHLGLLRRFLCKRIGVDRVPVPVAPWGLFELFCEVDIQPLG